MSIVAPDAGSSTVAQVAQGKASKMNRGINQYHMPRIKWRTVNLIIALMYRNLYLLQNLATAHKFHDKRLPCQ